MPEDAAVQPLRRPSAKTHIVHRPLNRHTKSSSRLNKLAAGNRSNLFLNHAGRNSSTSQEELANAAAAVAAVGASGTTGAAAAATAEPALERTASSHRLARISSGHNANGGHTGQTSHAGYGAHGLHLGHSVSRLAGTAPKRAGIIQLEKDDDSEDADGTDFEDMGSDEEPEPAPARPANDRSDSQLSIGIHPVEPTPPTISGETVVSVTSVADMASALKDARNKSAFVEDSDLLSTAMSRSQSTADMAKIVGGSNSNRTQRRQRLRQRQPLDFSAHQPSLPSGEGEYREFEKIFRVYANTRSLKNPVLSSFVRLSAGRFINGERPSANPSASSRLLNPERRVSSLSATTVEQMSDLTLRSNPMSSQYDATVNHVSNYVLTKMWQQGWQDPDNPRKSVLADAQEAPQPSDQSIQRQAQRVHNKLSRQSLPRRGSSIKLVQ